MTIAKPWTVDRIRESCTTEGDCWVWTKYSWEGKTPFARFGGKAGRPMNVRRWLAIELGMGLKQKWRVMAGRDCHQLCCNPDHLVILSESNYVREMSARGLHHNPAHRASMTNSMRARSEIMTIELAREIRARVAAGESRGDVADSLKLDRGYVCRIARGDAWSDTSYHSASVFTWRP